MCIYYSIPYLINDFERRRHLLTSPRVLWIILKVQINGGHGTVLSRVAGVHDVQRSARYMVWVNADTKHGLNEEFKNSFAFLFESWSSDMNKSLQKVG